MEKLYALLRSRKFWAALVGLVMVIAKAIWPDLPLQEEQVSSMVWVLAAYILGVAVEDGLKAA